MANTLFLNPGTEEVGGSGTLATDFASFFDTFASGTGVVSSASDQAHTGSRSIKAVAASAGDLAGCATFDGTCRDAGTAISFWVRLSTVTPTGQVLIATTETTGDGTPILGVAVSTGGKFVLCGKKAGGGLSKTGTASLSANTWTRVCISYVITSASNFTAKLYVNGVLDATLSNADGTLAATGAVCIAFLTCNSINDMSCPTPGAITVWYDDIYTDDRTDQSDTGDIRVTAKRPFSNGTTTGFTTQIGSGGSGYGSGHTPQVNERPLSQTNGWSMVVVGSAITEEYNIEGLSVGDVDLTGATIVDSMGWVFAKSLTGETASIVLKGNTSNISLTSTASMFQKIAGSNTYPAGTGTDIGIVTATTATTVSLYEAGILVAYQPAAAAPFVPVDFTNPTLAVKTPIDSRTHLDALHRNLLGKDQFFNGPGRGPNYDWPNPIPRAFPLEDRSFIDPSETWIWGKDAFFGAPGQVPDYDYPNPQIRQFPIEGRTFSYSSTNTTLSLQVAAAPFHKTEWPNPNRPAFSADSRGMASWFVLDDNTPFFGLGAVPNPKILVSPLENRTIADPTEFWLFGTQVQPPFFLLDWPNPAQKGFIAENRTDVDPSEFWFLKDQFFGGAGQPPSPTPAPSLRLAFYPTDLRTWTQSHVLDTLAPVVAAPFSPLDWPNPLPPRFAIENRSEADGSEFWLFNAPPPVPVIPFDWPNPTLRTGTLENRTESDGSEFWLLKDTFFGAAGQPPTYLAQPNPGIAPLPIGARTWIQALLTTTLAPQQANASSIYDWPNPRGYAYPINLRTAAEFTRLLGKDRIFGGPGQPITIWPQPNPLGYRYPMELRTGFARQTLTTAVAELDPTCILEVGAEPWRIIVLKESFVIDPRQD